MKIYIKKWSFWSPQKSSDEFPPLPFVSPLFKRRLSQLSRMTMHVIHDVSLGTENLKITFSSEYGEIAQQLKILEEILDSHKVSPARFSISVFNTPVAASTIAEKNTAGYSAICVGTDSFCSGLRNCVSALRSGTDKERIFVNADELLPEPYQILAGKANTPFAFALLLSSFHSDNCIELPENFCGTGLDFWEKYLRA